MLNCPICGAVVDGLTCGACGFSEDVKLPVAALKNHIGPLHDEATSARLRLLAKKARERYEAGLPTDSQPWHSYPSTVENEDGKDPQRWYNVCKYFPLVAAHCKPKFGISIADVGPDHPLDKTSKRGPIFAQYRRDSEADAERTAIQGEPNA